MNKAQLRIAAMSTGAMLLILLSDVPLLKPVVDVVVWVMGLSLAVLVPLVICAHVIIVSIDTDDVHQVLSLTVWKNGDVLLRELAELKGIPPHSWRRVSTDSLKYCLRELLQEGQAIMRQPAPKEREDDPAHPPLSEFRRTVKNRKGKPKKAPKKLIWLLAPQGA